MKAPTNSTEWWINWMLISHSVKEYISPIRVKDILENPRTPKVFGKIGMEVLKENAGYNPTIQDLWDRLTFNHDKRLYFLLHSVWADAPDSPVIHFWPNWHNFCDLLSEGPECLGLNEE